jgi:RNA binding exosome subunit
VGSTVPFHYLDLRAFCYATEDDRRVEDALRTLLPEDFPIERVENDGHHGDRILVLSARVETADDMRVVLDSLAAADAFANITDELDDRVDDNCALYLTLDKQAAFNGEVALGDGITVRGKIEAYPATKEGAIANLKDALHEV